MINPRFLSRAASAEYLGMSPNNFDALVRPHIPYFALTDSHKGKRWDRLDLDGWADKQPKMNPAGAGDMEKQTWQQTPPASSCEAKHGTSGQLSKSAPKAGGFRKQLAAKRKTLQQQSQSLSDAS